MSDTPSTAASAPRTWRPLEPTLRRVLGVLVEKAKTTPAGYPMSVNAIVAGCNQKNNREPMNTLDDFGVERALSDLAAMKAVSEIDWMGRVPKYKHHAHEWLGVTPVELAVLTELLLRGAQQMGELRARAARMEEIADQAALKDIVDGLVERGLVVALTPPGRGQVVTHNLYLGPEMDVLRARFASVSAGGPADRGHAPAPAPAREVRLVAVPDAAFAAAAPPRVASAPEPGGETLAAEVAALRAELAALTARVRELEERGR